MAQAQPKSAHYRSIICALDFFLRSPRGRKTGSKATVDIWVGNFNRHHPMWDHPRNTHLFTRANLNAAEELIAMTTQHGMTMALRPHIATLCAKNTKNLTRPDNVFVTSLFRSNVIQCEALHSKQLPKADHFPIVTTCQMRVARNDKEVGRNFRKVDWAAFEEELGRRLEGVSTEEIGRREEVEERLGRVMEALKGAVEKVVPVRRETTGMKRWWLKELTELRMKVRALGRELHRVAEIEGHQAHKAFRQARKIYGQAIRDTKRKHWEEWLGSMDTKSI